MQELTGIFVLAVFVEATVEYLIASLVKKNGSKNGLRRYIPYVAAVLGVGLCAAYQVDILAMVVGLTPIHPAIGWVVSGLIVGRGSNFLNDIVGLVRGDGGHDPQYRFRKTSLEGAEDDFNSARPYPHVGFFGDSGGANDK